MIWVVIGPHFMKNINVRTNVIELCNFGARIMIEFEGKEGGGGGGLWILPPVVESNRVN